LEHLDLVLNHFHGIHNGPANILIFGQIYQIVILDFFGEINLGFTLEMIRL